MQTILGNPDCQACGLHATARSVCLMGRGPVPCEILLVGEAPGEREDGIGKPFAGAAGKLLDRVLADVGVSRDSLYITNTVKCRPPDNRTPKTSEIKACGQYLVREFKATVPKYVLLLGATALKGVLKKTGITEMHGSIIEEGGITYMPAFHPAKILREPSLYGAMVADFRKFFDLVGGIVPYAQDLNLGVIENMEDFEAFTEALRESRELAFDIETTGLDRYAEDASILCIGFGLPGQQWILPLDNRESPWLADSATQRSMLEIIVELAQGKRIIAHNGKFDNLWLKHHHEVKFPLTFDTMLASFLLDENTPHGLKYLSKVLLGAPDYDIDLAEKMGRGNISLMYEYCARDVQYTLDLYHLFKKRFQADEALKNLFIKVMMPAAVAFETIEENGVYVDPTNLENVKQHLLARLEDIDGQLEELKPGLNWNSPQQVARLLFEELGLTPFEKTEGGADSTKESVLKRLKALHPIPDLLLQHREVFKNLSTYVGYEEEGITSRKGKKLKSKRRDKGWKQYLKSDNRMHMSFLLHGTVTGRLSSRLHQTPRDPLIRSLITAPSGKTLVVGDYSQIELRIAAILSGDRTMVDAYLTGQDLHRKTAIALMSREDITKEERKKAKAVNFGFIFGMGATKFQQTAWEKYELDLPMDECKRFRKRFFELYSGLLAWHERQRRIVHSRGEVRNLFGRIRHLPDIYSPDRGTSAEAERQAINSPVQSLASDLKLMTIVELVETFQNGDVQIVGEVHDSILMEIRTEKLDECLAKIHQIMVAPRLVKEFGVRFPIPIEADFEVGPWGKGENFLFDK